MDILLNEKPIEVASGTTVHQVRDRFKPQADVLILNGFPVTGDSSLTEGDRVVLIQRGETPDAGELQALLAARHTPGVHEKVRQATVGIAGLGGLGSSIAVALTRIGVGRLILADFDVVEPSNLNRQQYFLDQLGLPKTEALKQTLERIHPGTSLSTFYGRLDRENIPEIFAEADVVVEAFDAADQKAMLTETVLRSLPRAQLVAASGMAGFGPSNTIRTRRVTDRFYLSGDGETAARPGEGLMAPRVGIAAHHQANTVLRLLLGIEGESMEDDHDPENQR